VAFSIDYQTLTGAWIQAVEVRDNSYIWRKFVFECFTTKLLRVTVSRTNGSSARWQEIQAWGVAVPSNVASALAGATASGNSISSDTPANAIDDSYGTMWSAALGESLTVMFAKNECITAIDYLTAVGNINLPTQSTRFSSGGDVDFTLEYTNGTIWWLLETVKDNAFVWRKFTYPSCILAAGVRARVSRNSANVSAISELRVLIDETPRQTSLDLGRGWRDKSVYKPDDIDYNNEFGTDGYYIVGSTVSSPMTLTPNYLRNVSIVNPVYIYGSAPTIDNPNGGSMTPRRLCFNQTEQPLWTSMFSIPVNSSAVLPSIVRLGILVDSNSGDKLQAVRLKNVANNVVVVERTVPLDWLNGVLDWMFLDFEPGQYSSLVLEVLGYPEKDVCLSALSFDSVKEVPGRTNSANQPFSGHVPDYIHPLFFTGQRTVFGETARYKAAFGNVDLSTGNASWSGDAALVTTLENANLDNFVPYTIRLMPFSGESLASSFVTKSQVSQVDNSFGLQVTWRGYFDLQTADSFGFKKRSDVRYMIKRDVTRQVYHDATAEARVTLSPGETAQVTEANPPLQGVSIGVIVGCVAGGVLLVVCIAAVSIVISRRSKKTQKSKKQTKYNLESY
jgi:hypothetical protein